MKWYIDFAVTGILQVIEQSLLLTLLAAVQTNVK